MFKTLGGIFILVGLRCSLPVSLLLGLTVSINLFPFLAWFVRAFYYLPIQLIVIGGLYLKIVPTWVMSRLPNVGKEVIIYLSVVTSIVGVVLMWNRFNLVTLLVASRVYNSQIFVLGALFYHPIIFLFIYYFTRYILIVSGQRWSLWLLSALPPSPLFLFKINIIIILFNYNLFLSVLVFISIILSYFTYIKFISYLLLKY